MEDPGENRNEEGLGEEQWDGPSPNPPEEAPSKPDMQPVGINELKIVKGIEDSLKDLKGPRIQVIKSRDISNARTFSQKILRVLKMHGYNVHLLTMENIHDAHEPSGSDHLTVYSIDEDTIRAFLAGEHNDGSIPMQTLFDNSILSSVSNPLLISTVSDAYYGEVGIQKFNAANQPELKAARPIKKETSTSGENRFAIASFYLVAISFAIGGIISLFGDYVTFGNQYTTFTPLPAAMLVISVAAIAVRAFGLGYERKGSFASVSGSIAIFLVLLVLGIIAASYFPFISTIMGNTVTDLLSYGTNITYALLAFIVLVLSLSRYVLFLGRSAGSPSLFLSIAGVILLGAVIIISTQPYIPLASSGGFVSIGNAQGVFASLDQVFLYNTYDPIFGTVNYFYLNGTSQFLLLRNYILLASNLILAVAYLLGIKTLKETASGK